MINRKQITKVCDNCNECGLPVITCICNKIKKVESTAKFIILSSEKEVYRNTNTAALLKLVNPKSTEIIIWKREKKSQEIFKYINDEMYNIYLVFPDINEDMKKRKIKYVKDDKIPVFIIVDGTWKEAWKIIRKSDYLRYIPLISLETNLVSKFNLRRGQDEGNLCTIETAIEILKINEEKDIYNSIESDFELFLISYKAGSSGHKI